MVNTWEEVEEEGGEGERVAREGGGVATREKQVSKKEAWEGHELLRRAHPPPPPPPTFTHTQLP